MRFFHILATATPADSKFSLSLSLSSFWSHEWVIYWYRHSAIDNRQLEWNSSIYIEIVFFFLFRGNLYAQYFFFLFFLILYDLWMIVMCCVYCEWKTTPESYEHWNMEANRGKNQTNQKKKKAMYVCVCV